ncbi:MAG: hypothetical protein U0528_13125 [Anaerolineae bacterium]
MESGSSFSFLTPQFFDALIYGVIIGGVLLAAARIYRDFKMGPRWTDKATAAKAQPPQEKQP